MGDHMTLIHGHDWPVHVVDVVWVWQAGKLLPHTRSLPPESHFEVNGMNDQLAQNVQHPIEKRKWLQDRVGHIGLDKRIQGVAWKRNK